MEFTQDFETLVKRLQQESACGTVAVVCPYDEGTIEAIQRAIDLELTRFVLVGESAKLAALPKSVLDSDRVKCVEADSNAEAAAKCVEMARNKEVDVLMKGLIGTDVLLKAVLNKEHGILPQGNVLTHLTAAQIPGYHKLLFFSDVAVIPYPTIEQRRAILDYDLATLRRMGIDTPNVALIHFTEKVNPKFPNSTDYAQLIDEAAHGRFGNVEMGGPMDVKTACDAHSAQVKGIKSGVCGNADLVIFPNIESGNTFYKAITLFAGAIVAGMLQGAAAPVILPSRSDSGTSKFYSIVMATLDALAKAKG